MLQVKFPGSKVGADQPDVCNFGIIPDGEFQKGGWSQACRDEYPIVISYAFLHAYVMDKTVTKLSHEFTRVKHLTRISLEGIFSLPS
jgi:hypothetical protein